MIRSKQLLLLLTLFIISQTIQASHLLGGSITWRCLSNGKYVFYMEVYRDCTGIPFNFQDQRLDIVGNPLPTNGVTSITVKADSNRFINNRSGNTAPNCTNQYGNPYACSNGDDGMVQAFYYHSDPINLVGIPPSNGWRIYWHGPCCRPGLIENVNTTGSMLLRAVMYPGPNGVGADPCYDSSPLFRNTFDLYHCRGKEYSYSNTAIDPDLDDLKFYYDRPYNPPITNPIALSYKAGFSPNNPTPDTNFHPSNIPSLLDSITGTTNFAIYDSGFVWSNFVSKYITVIRVDAYNEGVKVASVYREAPLAVLNCDTLPNGKVNHLPEIKINGTNTNNYTLDVIAGQSITLPILANDTDFTGVGSQLQTLSLIPDGILFTNNRKNGFPCEIPGVEPCAFFQNSDPYLNTTVDPNRHMIQGLGTIATEFVWQTDCKHISSFTGFPGTNQSNHNFVMRVFDDHCPVPGFTDAVINVRVSDPVPISEPIIKGASVNLDGSVALQWAPPIDSVFTFEEYKINGQRPLSGAMPNTANWQNISNGLSTYKQVDTLPHINFPVYDFINPLDPNSGINIFAPFGTSVGIDNDFYIRMKTLSGCTDTVSSQWSNAVQIIEVNAENTDLTRELVDLKWNRAKPLNAASKPYFIYESPTTYYIYENDSVTNGKVGSSANWHLVDQTQDTSITISSKVCDETVGYRVEARDTIITFQQGQGLLSKSYDTLVFSTFSIIDTIRTVIATPNVRTNDVYFLECDIANTDYQWIDCSTNSAIPTANNRRFIPTKPGQYKVALSECKNDTSSCFTTIMLSDSVSFINSDTLMSHSIGANYQWVNCNGYVPINGATDSIFEPLDTGMYAVVVRAYGYADTSDCFPVFRVGIEENLFKEKVSIYPNPSNGQFKLSISQEYQEVQIIIRNIHGQLIQEFQLNNQTEISIDLNAESGVYFVTIINDRGEWVNLKIIKSL